MKKKRLIEQKELDELNKIMHEKQMKYLAFQKLRVSSLNSLYKACDPKYKKKIDEKTPLFCIKPLPFEDKGERKTIKNLLKIYDLFPNEDVIIKTVGNFQSIWKGKNHIFLIYTYYPYPDLYEYFFKEEDDEKEEEEETIEEKEKKKAEVCNITYQMLQILKLLKERKVLHNDIKLENFIVMQDKPLKIGIIDFDFAEIIKNKTNSESGTMAYHPPEYFTKKERSFPSDMWSLGICVYMALYKFMPFNFGEKPSFKSVNNVLMKCDMFKPDGVGKKDKAWLCVSAMLDKNPETRITPEKALKSEWFKSIEIQKVKKAGIKEITVSFVTNIYSQAQKVDSALKDVNLVEDKMDKKHKKYDDNDNDDDNNIDNDDDNDNDDDDRHKKIRNDKHKKKDDGDDDNDDDSRHKKIKNDKHKKKDDDDKNEYQFY